MMTPTDLAQYRATFDPDAWRASLAADPSPDGRTQLIVGASLAVRALCAEVERLNAVHAPAAPAPSPVADDLAFAREIAPGLAWLDNGVDVFAELPTGRAIAGDGWVAASSRGIVVAVGGYKLRHNLPWEMLVAEARHVLHAFGQRLARSTLSYRRAAGMAILVGMGEA